MNGRTIGYRLFFSQQRIFNQLVELLASFLDVIPYKGMAVWITPLRCGQV
jgi:hypothetical protein